MEPRHVSLLVGKRSYNILTSLDERSLREVYAVLHDAVADTNPSMDQDERLFIAAITLANDMVAISDRVDRMTKLIENMKNIWQIEPAEVEPQPQAQAEPDQEGAS